MKTKILCRRDRYRREFRQKLWKMLFLTGMFYAVLIALSALKT